MIFCVATDGKIGETKSLPECDLALFGFSGLGKVDYERELKGETEKFEEAARFSKAAGCGIVSGCITSSRGIMRKSAAVADRGKLLGISDMNYVLDGENYKSGASLGVYKVGGCKVGICIENDLFFPDAVKSLCMCGCNVIAALLEELHDNVPPLVARAYAYLYGVPFVMCAGKTAYFADITGAIATSAQSAALFEVSPQSRYHLVTTRTRGLYANVRDDY